MDSRREFLKKAALLSGSTALSQLLPAAIQRALAINPEAGSTWLDAEHIVFLMQENRSFDHTYGTLQGVRGFNDPRAIDLPNKNKVWLQSDKNGNTYAPFRLNIKDTKATWMSSLPHSWSNQVDARNEGLYDKWLDTKRSGHAPYAAMPLTMGYYNREDLPFYYALADAFTVCDHNFCSSLTGTTPNRLYFWSGTIREKADANAPARVWNEDADYDTKVSWKTYPERLEEAGVSWKVYQNELSVGVGFEGEEDGWLANFGDNPLEYFEQYNVLLSHGYITGLPREAQQLQKALAEAEKELAAKPADADKLNKRIEWIRNRIKINGEHQKIYTKEKYDALDARSKSIHDKAFATNINDRNYHKLTTIKYNDAGKEREVQVPAGDVLHQFREDVNNGSLPTVSWIVAPENFSDHPSSAWYGAWYISEVMDILTKNPEVWKKTIFVLTYDENDGYFDHLPPFVAPHPAKPGTGKVSAGIDTSLEFVLPGQQLNAKYARESSIGLGYRVPLVIASPWSRGGWVNSEVFDHTSSLQMLEQYLLKKKNIHVKETNMSEWRRTVCGDLTSVFRPYNNEVTEALKPVQRNEFVESIHQAKFKQVPDNFTNLAGKAVSAAVLPKQEPGIRNACSVPYEMYVDGMYNGGAKQLEVRFRSGDKMFGSRTAGAPYQVYATGLKGLPGVQCRSYAVKPGDTLEDAWALDDFTGGNYVLKVYGPNGFFRKFSGDATQPMLNIHCWYEQAKGKAGGVRLKITIQNTGKVAVTGIQIRANSYIKLNETVELQPGALQVTEVPVSSSYGWYDVSVLAGGSEQQFAGRVEDGKPGKTDPLMGGVA